jgi:hypothetical protein
MTRPARTSRYYGVADSHLFSALRVVAESGMQDKKVAVISIGTSTNEASSAWYEAVCLAWGSQSCTSFRPCQLATSVAASRERPSVTFEHPLIRSRCLGAARGERFDLVIAMNVAHHIGLGRFGEPVNPVADVALLGEILRNVRYGWVSVQA